MTGPVTAPARPAPGDDRRAPPVAGVTCGPHPGAGALAQDARLPRGAPPREPLRVLVVEDLAPVRRLLVRQLAQAGHSVVGEAATVAEAVARVRALTAGAMPPDVLVLDFHLPDGCGTDVASGLARHLRRGGPGGGPAAGTGHGAPTPGMVFCTGDVGAAVAAGAAAFGVVLEKPPSIAVLDRAVREAAAHVGLADAPERHA